ncbi:MAG: hypothetical protein IJW00_03345 [Clostridia bacterium]|nr:hypothetical protein [Clostridia bacterium]
MDNHEKYLATKTNPIKSQRATIISCALFGVLGLFLGGIGNAWGYGLLICGIALVIGALGLWVSSKNVWKIVFRNSTVTVTCRSEYYHMDDLKGYQISFEPQTPAQVAQNRGNMRITGMNYRGKNFPLVDVENFSEVKKYVEENF